MRVHLALSLVWLVAAPVAAEHEVHLDIQQKDIDIEHRTTRQARRAAIAKYSHMTDIGLYIVGHTDTVGPAADNQRLSDKRASAIANVFMTHGLKPLPIYVRGCGEGVPAIKTADNVAEAKNRRAQYIVSSFMPEFPGPGKWHRVQ